MKDLILSIIEIREKIMKSLKKNSFPSFGLKTVFFTFTAFFLLLSSTGEGDIDGKGHFRQGRKDLEASRYSEAIRALSVAQREFPLLEDYALYYLAEAYHGLGEHRKSLEMIQSLLERYPATPLRKKARMAELQEKKDAGGDALPLYEAYIKEYQEDEETLFLYGKLLRETGNPAKASLIFKKIYVESGELSHAALAELKPGDIKTKDVIERASNLFKECNFPEAERDLRQALEKAEGTSRTEILK